MRQRSGTDHQTKHQGDEVAALFVALRLILGLGCGDFGLGRVGVVLQQLLLRTLAGECGGVSGDRAGRLLGAVGGLLQLGHQGVGTGQIGDFLLFGLDLGGIRFRRSLQRDQFGIQCGTCVADEGVGGAGSDCGFQRLHLVFGGELSFLEDRAHRSFGCAARGRRIVQLLFLGGDFFQHLAVGDLRDRVAGVGDRQPHHRDHVGDDQDDVLRDLGPGHRAHAAEEGAYQDAGETDEHADLELDPGEARGDDADTVDLRNDVDERADDRGDDADGARQVAAVARAEKVRDGELAELPEVGGEEQRYQHVAAGPAHDEGEAVIAGEVEGAGHTDEGRGRHPVGAGRHAVEDGRDATAGDVVFGDVSGLRHDADAGVQHDGRREEDVANPLRRQAHLLQDREHNDEGDEAAGVEGVVLLQLLEELALGECCHYSSPSWTPYSLSSRFMR